jgi:hypothetical protein
MQLWFTSEEYRHFLSGNKAVAYVEKDDHVGAIYPLNVMQSEMEVEMGAGRILVQKKV